MTSAPPLHLLTAALARRSRGLRACGVLVAADLLVVDAIAERFGETNPDVLLGLAFAVRAPRFGHVGVDLSSVQATVDDDPGRPLMPQGADTPAVEPDWPADADVWQEAVLKSPMVGGPDDSTLPFVRQDLVDGRTLVMSRRMWREQERLANALRTLAVGTPRLRLDDAAIAVGVNRLFGDSGSQGARAVSVAARHQLTIVTGGPGTGKTYSIKRLLALLIEAQRASGAPLRIELAAPTGKAAIRMAEAIAEDLGGLAITEEARETLAASKPRTLHKLLGMRPDGTSRHGPHNPLAADLVVVDEASMVDLVLMRRLCEAVADGARLVLLGDRDQLASVEAGTVLADIVSPVLDGTHTADEPLQQVVVPFETNYRFEHAPTVSAIARALQGCGDDGLGDARRWMMGTAQVEGENMPHRVTHLGAPKDGGPSEGQLVALGAPFLTSGGFIGLLAAAIHEHGVKAPMLRTAPFHVQCLQAFEQYRVLAVHRRGPLGVTGIERAMATRAKNVLRKALRDWAGSDEDLSTRLPTRAGHWLGQPVMIQRNAYDVGLVNGDIGLVLPTNEGLAAIFPTSNPNGNGARAVALTRLPEHTGAFAMTVHKSQGSQFERVALVLAGRESPIQTRELIYTAITRTSGRLDWLGDADELQSALSTRVGRASGLRDLLWKSAVAE